MERRERNPTESAAGTAMLSAKKAADLQPLTPLPPRRKARRASWLSSYEGEKILPFTPCQEHTHAQSPFDFAQCDYGLMPFFPKEASHVERDEERALFSASIAERSAQIPCGQHNIGIERNILQTLRCFF